MQQHILHSFNEYAKSLRLKYKRTYCTHQKVHHTPPKPSTTANIYRPMKFLPPPVIESPQQRYTGIASLEKHIDDTKELVANNLPYICKYPNKNLNSQQHLALNTLKRKSPVITVKPADKNLGIVIMNTEDYIQQCMIHLSDQTTYRLACNYPATEIENKIANIIVSFKNHLEPLNKRLYRYLASIPKKHQYTQILRHSKTP